MKRPYLLQKRSKYWYWRPAGSKTFHSTGCTKEGNAHDFALKELAKEKHEEVTLREFTKDFFVWDKCAWIRKQLAKDHACGKSNAAARRRHLVKHILPAFGDRALYTLTKKEIEDWLAGLELSNQTRNQILYTFRIVLQEAKDAKLIAESPAADRGMTFGIRYVPRDVLSISELERLFPTDPKELRRIWWSDDAAVMFLVLASTGIRTGEARALQWKHVLWQESALLVERSVKGVRENLEIGSISEKKGGARVVLLPARALEALSTWQKLTFYAEPEDLVFPGAARNVPTKKTMSVRFAHALKRAGIDPAGRNLVAHSLRHTYNTIMRRRVPEEVLHALTGHSSAAMTDRYDHPQLAEKLTALSAARQAVEGLLPGIQQ